LSSSGFDCDALIIGGGLVGSVLATAFSRAKLRTVLIEARDPKELGQASFDDRSVALANGSQRILDGLGLWEALVSDAEPIRSIHISERGRFGVSRILATEEGVPALGYTLENRVLTNAIWTDLSGEKYFTCIAPAQLKKITWNADAVKANVSLADGNQTITGRLLVAADGARSSVRKALSIDMMEEKYSQNAVVLNIKTEVHHNGRAFERFATDGPLALLPLSRSRTAVVWTRPEEELGRSMSLDEIAFRDELQDAFGHRLGKLTRIGARSSYPLARVRSKQRVGDRAVLVGNAAVSLHPVAGQAFNVALRDVAVLTEIINEERASQGLQADIGGSKLLARYDELRRNDQRRVAAFTHALIRLFSYRGSPVAITRALGLMAFDLMPGAKAQLARHTMGLAGRLPRLARGLRLA